MKRFCLHLFVMILTTLSGALAMAQEDITIVMVGDSLTAGFNLPDEDALPNQLEQVLKSRSHGGVRIINAGVSGDTTADGLRRFAFSTGGEVDAVILALGGNDALNGLSVDTMHDNLDAMITQALDRNLKVLLVGLIPPLNLGEDYRNDFLAVFPALAEAYDLPLHADLMGEVALDETRLMADGIHPTPEGVHDMAERLAETVESAWLDGTGP